jgi:hypothetical protein
MFRQQTQLREKGGELTDRESLSLFHVRTFARHTDDSIGVLVHSKQDEDLLGVSELLLSRDVSGLSEDRGKLHCLSLRRTWFQPGSVALLLKQGIRDDRPLTTVAVSR